MPAVVPITHRRLLGCESSRDLTRFQSLLEPGDLVFAMASDSLGTQAIRAYQAASGYPERAASATHVAIWTDMQTIIHATAGQGCVEEGATCLLGRDLVIGRWHHPKKWKHADDVLAEARASLGRSYDMGLLFRESFLRTQPGSEPFICSTFVNSAFRTVMRQASPLHHGGLERKTPYICPAHLFIQPGLTDP